jgi:hypothetical protein
MPQQTVKELMETYKDEKGEYNFGVGPGWNKLMINLFKGIDKLQPEDFSVLQIKEKFGTLRFYFSSATKIEEINVLVRKAEKKSGKTCEDCGEPGKPRGEGWIRTICDMCEVENKLQRTES